MHDETVTLCMTLHTDSLRNARTGRRNHFTFKNHHTSPTQAKHRLLHCSKESRSETLGPIHAVALVLVLYLGLFFSKKKKTIETKNAPDSSLATTCMFVPQVSPSHLASRRASSSPHSWAHSLHHDGSITIQSL